MGLFSKKKEEEIPSLPDLPSDEDLEFPSKEDLDKTPGIPELETEELPKLPESKPKKILEIKPFLPPIPEMQKSSIESHQIKALKSQELPRTIEVEPNYSAFGKSITKKAEPIYIRLDKFETTAEAFEEIKIKIEELEELLRKTKEIKQKEEQELTEWEREIQMIKARIDSIDKNIFNKLD